MSCDKCSKSCHQQRNHSWWNWLRVRKRTETHLSSLNHKIALVGMPNVGKSVLFNVLTGTYATVSNYPGTTVEVSRGNLIRKDKQITIIDTPGLYSLLPITEEEMVARDLLFQEPLDLVIHVIDAKNLSRMLPLTIQLIETGLPVILVINMIDEAERLGIEVSQEHLELELGIPVIIIAAAKGRGIPELITRIEKYVSQPYQVSATH